MAGHGRWDGFVVRLYHTLGAFYYLQHWLVILGVGGFSLSALLFVLQAPVVFGVGLAVLSLGGLVGGVALLFKATRKRHHSPNPGLYLQTLEDTYVVAKNEYRFTRAVVAKTLHEGTDHYKHKFHWAGAGDVTGCVDEPSGYTLRLFPEALGTYQVCKVEFDRPRRKGEIVRFRYTLRVDKQLAIGPFLGLTITDQIRKAILRIRFEASSPRLYKKEIFLSEAAEIPIWEEEKSNQVPSDIFWKISRPRPRCRYRVSWQFGPTT